MTLGEAHTFIVLGTSLTDVGCDNMCSHEFYIYSLCLLLPP